MYIMQNSLDWNKTPKNLRKGPFRTQSFCRCQWQHKNKIIGRKQISFDYQMKYCN